MPAARLRLLALLPAALALACGPDISPGGRAHEPRASAPAAPAAEATGGALRLVAVYPPPGDIDPETEWKLSFDRSLQESCLWPGVLRPVYPDPQATFLEDPFRLTSARYGVDAAQVIVQPPIMLPGREVRLVAGHLMGADGSELAEADRELLAAMSWRIRELPAP